MRIAQTLMMSICLLTPANGGALEATATGRGQGVRDAVRMLGTVNARTLASVREDCARGLASGIRRKQPARGSVFPEVHAVCRAASDAAAARRLEQFLFLNLSLQDLFGIASAESELDFKRVSHGEPVTLMAAIVKAGTAEQGNYAGLSGNFYPLRPELAYAAGHVYGQYSPQNVLAIEDQAAYEVAARACFEETPVQTITVNGKRMVANRACVLVGAVAGSRYAKTVHTN